MGKALCIIEKPGKKRIAFQFSSSLSGGVDDGFHVVEIRGERLPPLGRERVVRPGRAPLEGLPAIHVPCIFQTPCMGAEVAVGGSQEIPQVGEREGSVHRQGAHDAEPDPLVDELVQLQGAGLGMLPRQGTQGGRVGRGCRSAGSKRAASVKRALL